MSRHAAHTLYEVNGESQPESEDDRIAAFDAAADRERVEPTQPFSAARQQAFRLVETSPPVTPVLMGAAAVLFGGAVGYWLGARRTRPAARKAQRTAARVEQAVELLPVAARLLANPVVRTLLIRMVMRKLSI
ncbi:MAG: hypothetical protein IT306_00640 [Chloroflexi bacterium]|nr:hypothetical protein [Chloroflexota bacterium]